VRPTLAKNWFLAMKLLLRSTFTIALVVLIAYIGTRAAVKWVTAIWLFLKKRFSSIGSQSRRPEDPGQLLRPYNMTRAYYQANPAAAIADIVGHMEHNGCFDDSFFSADNGQSSCATDLMEFSSSDSDCGKPLS
jgi:hypothetical protein